MYEIDKNGIERIITNSVFSGDERDNKAIKEALLATMRELCDYSHSVNQSLIEKSLDQNSEYRINDIYTVLLPICDDAEYEAVGLYRMAEPDDNRVFLDCEYDEIKQIVGDLAEKKSYKGRYIKDGKLLSFDYTLEFDGCFLSLQEELYDYAEHYSVKNPIMFSPYSHKSFQLGFDKSLLKDGIKLDFGFRDNHLPVLEGYGLYWNIKRVLEEGKTYDGKMPYADSTKYVFVFPKTKNGDFILPLPLNNQARIYDIQFKEKCVEVTTNHDIESFVELQYIELDLNSRIVKESQSKGWLFSNDISDGIWRVRRLLSEGDIERAIACFREWHDVCCERSSGDGRHIARYSKKYRSDRKNKNMFNTIRREHIRIAKTSKRFLTDYANYILEYLEYYYPEIEWAGEE